MKHNWQLECTIDEFVDMVIEEHPELKHLASIIVKCEQSHFQYENSCFSDDEYSAMIRISENEIEHIIHMYSDDYKLYNLMNPHLRRIYKRSASYLAPRLGITEVSARQLKNTARSNVYHMLSTACEYLLFRTGREIPTWLNINKDIKKYFKEN